jgi:DNA-binding NtrC family response regulator
MAKLLIIDDDNLFRYMICSLFDQHQVFEISHPDQLKKFDQLKQIKLAIVDLNFNGEIQGLKAMEFLTKNNIPFITMSSELDDELVEQCYLSGCLDFFQKDDHQLVKEKVEYYLNNQINHIKPDEINKYYPTSNTELLNEISEACSKIINNQNIFINGETGVGKGHLAKLLHQLSKPDKPFVSVNLQALSDQLFESEVFGHVKGAFTGAHQDKVGLLEQANDGIIFLDEICSLKLENQIKLLKVIEEQEFYPVGSSELKKVNFTVISAAQPDIYQKIDNKQFRKDLYFRLASTDIHIPPLRNRLDDILLLVNHYSRKGKRIIFKQEALEMLMQYDWPGNTRELINLINNLKAGPQGIIRASDIKLTNSNQKPTMLQTKLADPIEIGLKKYIQQLEYNLLTDYLAKNNHNVRKTVQQLQLSFSSFYTIMNRYK